MVIGGVLLMILGALLYLAGSSALPVGGSSAWSMVAAGGGLFWIGLGVALAGAVVSAIERAAERQVRALASLDSNLRTGIDSLWKELEAIRSHGVALPDPPAIEEAVVAPVTRPPPAIVQAPGAVPVMGYCPGCRKLRATNVTKCIYCADTSPPLVG